MAKMPTGRAREIAAALAKLGFNYECPTSGNHHRFRHPQAKGCVHISGSPSDCTRALRNAVGDAKRILRQEGVPLDG